MSERYPGGFMTQSPPVPTATSASGVWTLDQQEQLKQAGQWPANGPFFVEDVFSTYLYTGTGAAQTITNGIDVAGKGGLVWIKARSVAEFNVLVDSARGASKALRSSSTAAEVNDPGRVSAFTASGFTIGTDGEVNGTGNTHASWTFRKQPKFFDVVTFTGDGVQPRAIAHSLGSTPGCVIVKNTSAGGGWYAYHVGANAPGFTAAESYMLLNSTNAVTDNAAIWGNTAPSGTTFTVSTQLNQAGNTYVAYLWAHNAGGFGLSGNENVISCGTYTGVTYPNSLEVNLGFEPQWVLIKNATTAAGWAMWDVMRGMSVVPAANTAQALLLEPNTSAAESNQPGIYPTPTGFVVKNGLTSISGTGDTITYIAIRRGPMAVPTLGTTVFSTSISSSELININSGFVTDMVMTLDRSSGGVAPFDRAMVDRLRGNFLNVSTASTAVEVNNVSTVSFQQNNGIYLNGGGVYANGYVYEQFKRAPGFFDEVCYTGTGTAGLALAHNLGVVPELIIAKRRTGAGANWPVYSKSFNGGVTPEKYYTFLTQTDGTNESPTAWNDTAPSSTAFTVGTAPNINASGGTYVAYLFATCAGVSKVGSYTGTGTGTTQAIACGFTAGARFVLIKRIDLAGDWYVWDSARGIVAGNDPYLLLNSTAAEVTNTDYIDTFAAGFELSSTAPAAINASGGSYIFLAIS